MSQKKCRIIKVANLRPGYKDYRENFLANSSSETSPPKAGGGESVGEVDLLSGNEQGIISELSNSLLSVYYVSSKTVWKKPGYSLEIYRRDDLDL